MALTPDLATFRVLYPEFADVPDNVVLIYLDEDEIAFSPGAWGRCYGKAVLLFAAHELALRLARAASVGPGGVIPQMGVLQSGHEEGIAFAFAKTAPAGATSEWLSLSPYGAAFAALQRQCLSRAALSW